MRTFVKSIVFAVAMLLSVSVWAGNPENAPVCNNVQHAVTVQPVNEVKDVQQIPCVMYWNICDVMYQQYLGDMSAKDCERVSLSNYAVMDFYNMVLGCD